MHSTAGGADSAMSFVTSFTGSMIGAAATSGR
jgi:hypothetical protein